MAVHPRDSLNQRRAIQVMNCSSVDVQFIDLFLREGVNSFGFHSLIQAIQAKPWRAVQVHYTCARL